MKAYELIVSKENFCCGNFALNSEGYYTNPAVNPDNGLCKAVKWDLQGALLHCYPLDQAEVLKEKARLYVENVYNKSISDPEKRYKNLHTFNDSAPHEHVISVLKAIEGRI